MFRGRLYLGGERSAGGRGLLAALILATLLVLGFGPENSTLVFVEEGPLELDSQATKGADVLVCNVGQRLLSNVAAKDGGFPEGKGVDIEPKEGPTQEPVSLARGECLTYTLTLDAGLKSDTAKYKGLLIVSAEGVKSIVRDVLVGPEEAEKMEVSAVAKPFWLNNRWVPRWVPLLREAALPLKLKKGGFTDTLALSAKKDEVLGVLSGGVGDGHAQVVVDQEPPEGKFVANEAGVASLPIRAEGLDGVGTYSGTLTVDGAEFETEFFVSHALPWGLIPIVFGFLAGWVSLRILKRNLPIGRLEERCKNLEGAYEDAVETFHKHAVQISAALRLEQNKQTDAGTRANEDDIKKLSISKI